MELLTVAELAVWVKLRPSRILEKAVVARSYESK
jgi:hypothetical protein